MVSAGQCICFSPHDGPISSISFTGIARVRMHLSNDLHSHGGGGKLKDFTYDHEHECYVCPNGTCLQLEAWRHKIGNNLYHRYEADEAECSACRMREKCLQNAKTRRKHLAVF